MITKSDLLPSIVAIVGIVNIASPNGMLDQWRQSMQQSVQDQQFQVESFSVSIPPNWQYQEGIVYLPDGTACEIKQAARSEETMSRLISLLKNKYPELKVVDNNSQKVLVLDQKKSIAIFESKEQYLLVTVPLKSVSDLLSGFSVNP